MPLGQGWSIIAPLASFGLRVSRFFLETWRSGVSPAQFRRLEEALHRQAGQMCDRMMANFVRQLIEKTPLEAQARRAFRDCAQGSWESKGRVEVGVRFLGGTTHRFRVSYLWQPAGQTDGPAGLSRPTASRRGSYPVLEACGIAPRGTNAHLTAACARRALRDVVRASSLQEAADIQKEGSGLTVDQLHGIFETTGQQAVGRRDDWKDSGHGAGCPAAGVSVAGGRVLVMVDGGRCRQREAKPGRPKANGRHGLNCPWREPKVLRICLLDEHGKIDPDFPSIIDGTMGDADAVFELLEAYLSAIDIDQAACVEFAADGAKWIWKRVGPMLDRLGVSADRRFEVVDFYHGAETLSKAAHMPTNWCKGTSVSWFKKMRRALKDGAIELVCKHLRSIADKPGGGEAEDHIDYFERNADRMQYPTLRKEGLASGSGAVESAIRRVVNMRSKHNSTYWKPENAEKMLMLRGYLKAGRFDGLWTWLEDARTAWWTDPDARDLAGTHTGQSQARSAA